MAAMLAHMTTLPRLDGGSILMSMVCHFEPYSCRRLVVIIVVEVLMGSGCCGRAEFKVGGA